MMIARSDSAAYPDISAALEALASASGSGASSSSETYIFVFGATYYVPILHMGDLSLGGVRASALCIENTFATLEARLSGPPDPDLLNAAEQLAARLSSEDDPELSDEWIEAISDRWSAFRD